MLKNVMSVSILDKIGTWGKYPMNMG